jgi:hypothetical protein
MILKIFSLKNSGKKLAFWTQNKAKLCKNLIITLVFEKNANFFAENWRKSQKIVIITSVPDKDSCIYLFIFSSSSSPFFPLFFLVHRLVERDELITS